VKALIIEDDREIVESVSQVLRMRWPAAELESTHLGSHGLELAESSAHSIVILDIGLPDMNGLDVLKGIRSFSRVPVVILSARSEEFDIVKGLEWGADDYIVKPCGPLELLSRVKARVREDEKVSDEDPLTFGPLTFRPLSRRLEYGARSMDLTAIESLIMLNLMRNAGQVSIYAAIAEEVWGDDRPDCVDSLRVHIRRLRQKVEEDPSRPQFILTRCGVGYFLREPPASDCR
jgi:two-component system KDP operon response regulator KdpE